MGAYYMHPPALVAARGFAPDVKRMINAAAKRVLSCISVFDAPSSPTSLWSGKIIGLHRLLHEDLSSMMIDAAVSDRARSLGVQPLVIGQSTLSS